MTMRSAALPCSDRSDLPKGGRNSRKATEMLACSDHSDRSDLKGDGRAENEYWSAASWRARRLSFAATQAAVAARIAFYLVAMADAAEALAEPDPDLDAERAVMAAGRGQVTDGSNINLRKEA